MFEKTKVIKTLFPIMLALVMVCSCLFAVPAAAAAETDVNVLNIEDYVSKKQLTGNDVIITYDLPLEPVGEFVMTDGDASYSTVCDGQYITWAIMQETGTTDVYSYKQVTSDRANTVYMTADYSFADLAGYGQYCGSLLSSASVSAKYASAENYFTYFWCDGTYYLLQNVLTGVLTSASGSTAPYKLLYYGDFSLLVTPNVSYLLSKYSVASKTCHFGRYTVETVPNYAWDTMQSTFNPLGYADDNNTIRNVINIDDFRTGATFSVQFEYSCDLFLEGVIGDAASMFEVHYLSKDLEYVGVANNQFIVTDVGEYYTYTVRCELTVPEDAAFFYISYDTGQFEVKDASFFAWSFYNLQMISTLSAIQDTSKTMDRVVKRLDQLESDIEDLNQGIQDTNDKLDDLNQGVQDTNDKLDDLNQGVQDTNDKLDDLPDQIGDQFQDVMDGEKDEALSTGDKYVDQILEILPDSSTEILAALRSLTDAMSYTGTEAILPIPGIVLPGIDGLIPRTTIWGGADFNLGDYVEMLPENLLSLVRNLFTIAIVLFCAYELKGIISYCLTLKDSKGG